MNELKKIDVVEKGREIGFDKAKTVLEGFLGESGGALKNEIVKAL